MFEKKPAYPLGIATLGQNGSKTKGNRHIPSERKRRRAFAAKKNAILGAVRRRWGDPSNMPESAVDKLQADFEKLKREFGV